MRISDWSSDVCSSDLLARPTRRMPQREWEYGCYGRYGAKNALRAYKTRRSMAGWTCSISGKYVPALPHGDLRPVRRADPAAPAGRERRGIGRAHARHPVTNTHVVIRHLLETTMRTH